jgi:hypothetical protein
MTPDVQVQLGGGPVDVDAQNAVSSKYNGVKITSPSRRCSRLWDEKFVENTAKKGPRFGPAAYHKYKMRAQNWRRFPDPFFSKLVLRLFEKSKSAAIRCQPPFQPLERQSLNSAKVFEDEFAHLHTENLAPRYV